MRDGLSYRSGTWTFICRRAASFSSVVGLLFLFCSGYYGVSLRRSRAVSAAWRDKKAHPMADHHNTNTLVWGFKWKASSFEIRKSDWIFLHTGIFLFISQLFFCGIRDTVHFKNMSNLLDAWRWTGWLVRQSGERESLFLSLCFTKN